MNHIFFASEDEELDYDQLKLKEFNQSNFSIIYMKYLKGGLFHSTTISGFRGIIDSGYISPNKGKFAFTFPQSKRGFSVAQNFISLFDFSAGSEHEIIYHFRKFNTFFCMKNNTKIILEINKEKLTEEIIPNNANPPLGNPDHKYYIPVYEVWYPINIQTSAISKVIVTSVVNKKLHLKEFLSIDLAVNLLV